MSILATEDESSVEGRISPDDPTVSDMFELLDHQTDELVQPFLEGGLSFWIGSGISREQFPGVGELLRELLERLSEEGELSDQDDPYRRALSRIVDLTIVDSVDLGTPFSEWPDEDRQSIIRSLQRRYSKALQQHVNLPDGETKYLDWDILALHEKYSDEEATPGPSHLFIALLCLEGALSELISFNWDLLIEKAFERYGATSKLKIVREEGDLLGQVTCARLLKAHGCAEHAKAKNDRNYYVATDAQIQRWCRREGRWIAMQEEVRTSIRRFIPLFLGLSGQDWNIQAQIHQSLNHSNMNGVESPRVLFAEPAIESPQRAVLTSMYGEEDFNEEVSNAARVGVYARPLLGTLYLRVIFEKLEMLLEQGESVFPDGEFLEELSTKAEEAKEHIIHHLDEFPAQRWENLVQKVPAYLSSLLRTYLVSLNSAAENYVPLPPIADIKLPTCPMVDHASYHWLIAALLILKDMADAKSWRLSIRIVDERYLGLAVEGTKGKCILFLFRSPERASVLIDSPIGAISDAEIFYIYPADQVPRGRMSPRGRVPKKGAKNFQPIDQIGLPQIASDTDVQGVREVLVEMLVPFVGGPN